MFENVAAGDLLTAVRAHDFDHHDDYLGADHIDAIKAMDRVVRAAQAEQARHIAELDRLRATQMTLGRGDHSLSIIGELGMARNISPSAAGNHYGFAVGLARLPQVAKVFASGGISEPAARNIVAEATGLTGEQAAKLDERLAARIPGMTPLKARNLARQYAIGIDSAAAEERAKANRLNRFVSFFPETDGVAVLQIRGPAEQLLSAYNALDAAAAAAKAAGDLRTRGQVMCDEFVARATGQKKATDVNIEIGLVMTAGSLMRTDQSPALLAGYGPIPPELAHNLIAAGRTTWIRRLFTDPVDGSLVDCDQRRRRFTGKTRHLITTRDRVCRQPGCNCRVGQLDHIIAHQLGGPTTVDNGQGLCIRSHTLKHLPGWRVSNQGGDITGTTPTGHRYRSKAPALIEYRPGPGHLRQ
ncbi:MAG: HNH endonuclease [Actinomycetota bacterium]|nr:HNH endonuclease [Actinomycetota bacterium]